MRSFMKWEHHIVAKLFESLFEEGGAAGDAFVVAITAKGLGGLVVMVARVGVHGVC